MAKRKKNIVIAFFEFVLLFSAEKILLSLPEKLAYKTAETLAKLIFLLDVKHRKRTMQHLLHASIAANFAEAKEMAKRNFIHFADMLVDTIRFKRVYKSKEDISRSIELSGDSEHIYKFLRAGAQNAIVITAHYGNWEISGISYTCLTNNNMLSVMREFDNPFLEKVVVEKRSGYGLKLVKKKSALKPLLRALKNKNSVCIFADQHAGREEGVEVKFFGHPASAHKSPALLQNKSKIPIFTGVCERLAPLKYKIKIKTPIYFDENRTVEETVQLYTSQIEELIRENPLQWCWAHRRWLDINR